MKLLHFIDTDMIVFDSLCCIGSLQLFPCANLYLRSIKFSDSLLVIPASSLTYLVLPSQTTKHSTQVKGNSTEFKPLSLFTGPVEYNCIYGKKCMKPFL